MQRSEIKLPTSPGSYTKQRNSKNFCFIDYAKAFDCVSSVQSLRDVQLFVTPWTAAQQASLPITNSWSLLKLMSIELMCHPIILSSTAPFSRPQSFPESGSFPMCWIFASGGQSIGASASAPVLPVNIHS